MSGRQPEETWTDTIHNAITSTSTAVHRAVDAIAGAVEEHSSGTTGTTGTHTGSTTTASASSHPFASGTSSTTGFSSTEDTSTGPTFGTALADKGTPASHVGGLPGSTTSSAPRAAPLDRDYKGETTTGMNTHTGVSYGSLGKTEFSNDHPSTTHSGTSNLGKTEFSNHPSATQGPSSTSTGNTSTSSTGQRGDSGILTDSPSHTSTERSDPSPSPSGPAQGGTDASQSQSKQPSSSLPPPQTSGEGSATSRGDAPGSQNQSISNQRQVNKGESIGSTSDEKSRLKGTQQDGPVSMSGTQTSHPGAGATPAAGAAAPVGDPSSGQGGKTDKKGAENPLKEPPKSEKDANDPGTGQQYVKSSGVAAEGGDFDAAKPGAGVWIPMR